MNQLKALKNHKAHNQGAPTGTLGFYLLDSPIERLLNGTQSVAFVDQLWKVKQEVGLREDRGCGPFNWAWN